MQRYGRLRLSGEAKAQGASTYVRPLGTSGVRFGQRLAQSGYKRALCGYAGFDSEALDGIFSISLESRPTTSPGRCRRGSAHISLLRRWRICAISGCAVPGRR